MKLPISDPQRAEISDIRLLQLQIRNVISRDMAAGALKRIVLTSIPGFLSVTNSLQVGGLLVLNPWRASGGNQNAARNHGPR